MKFLVALSVVGLWIAAIVGWVLNIVAIFKAPAIALWGGFEVARVIGVFLGPLGAVLGYF
jgi:hypothetical protein